MDKKHTNKLRSDQFIADANTHTEQTEIYIYIYATFTTIITKINK